MNIIKPLEITAEKLGLNTSIQEPSGSEVEWSSSSVSYTVGQYVKRTTTRRTYRCILAHTSAASPVPESDLTRWLEVGCAEYEWAASVSYSVGDVVTRNTTTFKKYVCKVAHTSAASPVPENNTDQWLALGSTEQAWTGATVSHPVGVVVARPTTHRKYKCAVAHTGAATPLPEDDPTRWVDIGPTDRFAPFDIYTATAALTVEQLTYVITPGYCNALAMYGLTGSSYTITVREEADGAVIAVYSGFLSDDPIGWYEYLFSPQRMRKKLVILDIPIRPGAEFTIELESGTGQPVGVGMIVLGDYVPLIGAGPWGGTMYGSSVEPVTYSYIKTEDDGTTTIKRRHAATNMRARVTLPRDQIDYAVEALQEVLDVPVAWIATDCEGYAGLTTFGLGSSSAVYESYGHGTLEIFVKGLI